MQIRESDEITSEERERRIAETIRASEMMTDDDIDYSDIPPVRNFSEGVRGRFYRPFKDQVTLRIDRDVLSWFRYNHEKYQTAINEALREHMNRERKSS